MKNLAKFLFLVIVTALGNTVTSQDITEYSKTDKPEKLETIMNDTTPKVTGIGGIFFRFKNPAEAKECRVKTWALL